MRLLSTVIFPSKDNLRSLKFGCQGTAQRAYAIISIRSYRDTSHEKFQVAYTQRFTLIMPATKSTRAEEIWFCVAHFHHKNDASSVATFSLEWFCFSSATQQ